MDHVKLKIEEIKGNAVYTFGFAYQNKAQEIKWVENAIVASKDKDGAWTYNVNKSEGLNQDQFSTYGNLLAKITQVVDTNAMNLSGIKVVKDEPKAASAKQ